MKYTLHKVKEGYVLTTDEQVSGTLGFDEESKSIMFFASHPKYDESGKKIVAVSFDSKMHPLSKKPKLDFSTLSYKDCVKLGGTKAEDLEEILSDFYVYATEGEVCNHEVIEAFIKTQNQTEWNVEVERSCKGVQIEGASCNKNYHCTYPNCGEYKLINIL